jgi:hypothetical protein
MQVRVSTCTRPAFSRGAVRAVQAVALCATAKCGPRAISHGARLIGSLATVRALAEGIEDGTFLGHGHVRGSSGSGAGNEGW